MSYLLGIDARYYSFRYMAQCREVVRKAMEDGAVLGIGGADSAVAADELGLEHLTVENSEQSLLSAIQAAEQLLQLKREEAKKRKNSKSSWNDMIWFLGLPMMQSLQSMQRAMWML